MSNQPTDPQAAGEPIDDLDLPADEADAVTGGAGVIGPADDAPDDRPDGQLQAI